MKILGNITAALLTTLTLGAVVRRALTPGYP